jgi:hypothetical protein
MDIITNNEVYKQVVKDSYGGVLYNVANFGKYDATQLLEDWDALSPQLKDSANGIIKDAINFLKEA